LVGVRYLPTRKSASEGVYLRFWTPRERREALLLSSVFGGLRISEVGAKHGSFWPFLGDLRRGKMLSSIITPPS
jgi:hypothetical protein